MKLVSMLSSKSFPLKLIGKDIVQLGTPIRLPDHVRSQLVQVCARNLNYDLLMR